VQPSNIDTHFGGPDLAKNLLRDVLHASILQTPSGAEIKWLCYYLNDQTIIDALIGASRRSVNVTILIDKNPRTPQVNETSIRQLKKHISPTLQLVMLEKKHIWQYLGIQWHAHFHGKCYYFSGPEPHAYVGSYNPTAGSSELPHEVIKKIGDHSISHNVLVKVNEPYMISMLLDHIRKIQQTTFINNARRLASQNRSYIAGDWQVDFLPRIRNHPVDNLLNQHKPADIKCAISHLKGSSVKNILPKASKRHHIELLLEKSERRIPQASLDSLHKNKIITHQPTLPDNCLMHSKFILYDDGDAKKVMFGSFNWSTRSRLLNHEIIMTTTNQNIYNDFYARWMKITSDKN
jgi:phosphatidylserine/phosphatidylglycerophosphate/cardiolipin synthase-like enzyme